MVIPWFLIPGRPYPIQVYLFACSVYSANPGMGQRGAAEATRKMFKLEKLSHSTVSRSFRSFEESREQGLQSRFGEETKGACAESLVSAVAKTRAKKVEASACARRFRSVADTAERRKEMAEFLQDIYGAAKTAGAIEAASRKLIGDWHKKTSRLLL